jgi:hypothetical protein
MRKLSIALLLLCLTVPALAQYQGRLSSDDQRRFDSYYQRWQDYKRTNNRDEIISMEKRMQDVMQKYNISATVPYAAIANNGRDEYRQYRGMLGRDDQRRFDSYYSRWLDYKRTSNWDEVRSMEGRMQDVMRQYNVPLTVPYAVLSSTEGGWAPQPPRWTRNLSADDQRRFDSYYSRWLGYRSSNDWDNVRSMEARMRDVMQQYDIPSNVPFDQIVSSAPGGGQPQYRGDLQILSATYGYGNRMANVTQRLQQMVRGNQLSVYVDNDSMGSDPAPGMRKSLTVSYSYRGRPQTVTAREGLGLTIP